MNTDVEPAKTKPEPAPTVVETPALAPAGAGPTLVSEPGPKVSPTMVDHGDRATPIAPFPPAHLPSVPRAQPFQLDVPPPRRESGMLPAALAIVFVIFGAILLWWLARLAR
jgi:hypothetical protein